MQSSHPRSSLTKGLLSDERIALWETDHQIPPDHRKNGEDGYRRRHPQIPATANSRFGHARFGEGRIWWKSQVTAPQ